MYKNDQEGRGCWLFCCKCTCTVPHCGQVVCLWAAFIMAQAKAASRLVSCSQEKRLLEASKSFDKAIQDRDQAAVEALFADNATVHKGARTLADTGQEYMLADCHAHGALPVQAKHRCIMTWSLLCSLHDILTPRPDLCLAPNTHLELSRTLTSALVSPCRRTHAVRGSARQECRSGLGHGLLARVRSLRLCHLLDGPTLHGSTSWVPQATT